jgi:hypothetical protein
VDVSIQHPASVDATHAAVPRMNAFLAALWRDETPNILGTAPRGGVILLADEADALAGPGSAAERKEDRAGVSALIRSIGRTDWRLAGCLSESL